MTAWSTAAAITATTLPPGAHRSGLPSPYRTCIRPRPAGASRLRRDLCRPSERPTHVRDRRGRHPGSNLPASGDHLARFEAFALSGYVFASCQYCPNSGEFLRCPHPALPLAALGVARISAPHRRGLSSGPSPQPSVPLSGTKHSSSRRRARQSVEALNSAGPSCSETDHGSEGVDAHP